QRLLVVDRSVRPRIPGQIVLEAEQLGIGLRRGRLKEGIGGGKAVERALIPAQVHRRSQARLVRLDGRVVGKLVSGGRLVEAKVVEVEETLSTLRLVEESRFER